MTRKEFDLLWLMSSDPGKVFDREDLMTRVWKESSVESRTIDAHIVRLRRKLQSKKGAPSPIETVWGLGYRLKVSSR
ncbi:MAG: winged helix-turn-helix domain-containing protein [Nitrospiraceae bacterium]